MLREERTQEAPPTLFPLPFSLIGLYKHYGIVDATTLHPPFQQEGLALFDLRAVERRLRFDTLLENRIQQSQGLLIPLTFHCSLHEAELLTSFLELLKQGGLLLERAGKNTFLINALPPFLKEGDVPQILTRILASHTLDQRQIALLLSERVSSHYSLFTAQGLIENLLKSKEPARCPKGKPTVQYIIPEDRCD
jgi:DNA mismatch repair ATPase MutL